MDYPRALNLPSRLKIRGFVSGPAARKLQRVERHRLSVSDALRSVAGGGVLRSLRLRPAQAGLAPIVPPNAAARIREKLGAGIRTKPLPTITDAQAVRVGDPDRACTLADVLQALLAGMKR